MDVFTGRWKDEASNKLILTLAIRSGGFLAAALVIWIGFVGNATWPIFRFLLWCIPTPRDEVFYLQRQVLVRNSSSAAEAFTSLAGLVREWKQRRYTVRSLPHLIVTALLFMGWALTAMFVPFVHTRSPDRVLIRRSSHCGYTNQSLVASAGPAVYSLGAFVEASLMEEAQAYVQRCYGSHNSPSCTAFPRQSIRFIETPGAPCPLASADLCITTNSTVLQLDTGLVDSSKDFGINTKASDSVQYRRLTTCSPFRADRFVRIEVSAWNRRFPNETVYWFDLGPENGHNFTFSYHSIYRNNLIPYTIQ